MKQKILKFLYKVLAFFTRIYLKRTKTEIIWITWSVGKTSCRMIVYWTLKKFLFDKKIYTSPKNYNSEIWLVCSIFQIEDYKTDFLYIISLVLKIFFKSIFSWKKYDIFVLEYWVDKPKDMDFLLSIAKPDIAVFTKLDFIHVANFRNQSEIWTEKAKLLDWAKKMIFLNKQDDFQRELFEKIAKEKYFYNEKELDFDYKKEDEKIYSLLKYSWRKIQSNLLWNENLVYLELSLKILEKFWFIFKEEFVKINFDLQAWRFSIFSWKNNSILIDSTYNSGPESMKSMIHNSFELRKNLFPEYENLFVLGDMREIWEKSDEKHKELFDFVSKYGQVFSVWKETWKNFWKHLWNFKYSSQAWKILFDFLEKNKDKKYLILFKWSQNTIFLEEALKEVLKNKNDEKFLVRQEKYWKKTDF